MGAKPDNVHVTRSLVVRVSAPVMRSDDPSRVSRISGRFSPQTGSEKTIVTLSTAVFRGSGETAVMETVGGSVSITSSPMVESKPRADPSMAQTETL